MSDAVGKFFFSLHKGVVEVVELGKLLVECHKLFVGAGLRERFGMQFVKFASAIEQLGKSFNPQRRMALAKGLRKKKGP